MSEIVACPHCGMHVANDGSRAGQIGACPKCHGKFMMPALSIPPVRTFAAPEPAHDPLAIDTSRRGPPSRFVPPVPAQQGMTAWQIVGAICTVIIVIGGVLRLLRILMLQR
jgi:hypothetical protein